jgi:hypothetical protein
MVSFTPRPRERVPGSHFIEGGVDPRTGPDAAKKRKIFCPCLESNPGRPVRSPSPYRLRYAGSIFMTFSIVNCDYDTDTLGNLSSFSPSPSAYRADRCSGNCHDLYEYLLGIRLDSSRDCRFSREYCGSPKTANP